MKLLTRAAGLAALVAALSLQTATLHAVTNGTVIPSTDLQPGGAFEWLVRLENDNGTQRCTGSLVEQQWVLSAAHCASQGSGTEGGITRAFVGSASTPIAIDNTVGAGAGDVILFHLAAPAGPAIDIARIAPSFLNLTIGQGVEIAGWGLTNVLGATPASPSAGTMIATSLTTLNGVRTIGLSPQPSNICAGDSGGPVFLRDANGTAWIYGVSSFSDPDCTSFGGAAYNDAFADEALAVVGQDKTAPVALSGSRRTPVDTPVTIPIEFSDPDGTPMTFANIVPNSVAVKHGTITGCAGSAPPTTCTFQPEPDFAGIASYRYQVTDGTNTATASWDIEVYDVVTTVTVTQARVQEPTGKPELLALDVFLSGPATGPVPVTLTPIPGAAIAGKNYRTTASKLVLTNKNRTASYRIWILADPDINPDMDLELAITVPAGVKLRAPQPSITIIGDPINQSPVVQGGSLTARMNTPFLVPVYASDPEGTTLGVANVDTTCCWDTSLVQLTGSAPSTGEPDLIQYLQFTPAPGFTGSFILDIGVTDGFSWGSGLWDITVTP